MKVDDSEPTEEKIEEAVKNLRRNRSGAASWMRAEHLKGWLAASKRGNRAAERGEEKTEGEEEEGEHWENLVDLIHTAFWDGEMAEEATWQAVAMIPKGEKEYR